MKDTETTAAEIRLRVTVVDPPTGVDLKMQRGRSELISPTNVSVDSISFDITLRLGKPLSDGWPNFLGEFAQGTPQDRFLYVNSGIRAGQNNSQWDRRAKVKLFSIDNALIQQLRSKPGSILEAKFAGIGRDGGPACATVPLLDGGWKVVEI